MKEKPLKVSDEVVGKKAKSKYYSDSWAVVVGINQYKEWPKLSYAVNDVKAIENKLIKQFGFKQDHIFSLYDQNATRDNIMELLANTMQTSYLNEITNRTARQILTAGGADQQVIDGGLNGHSIFTWTLLKGLDGEADLDKNHIITASELGAYISPLVANNSNQTPAFGNLLGSEGGSLCLNYLRLKCRQKLKLLTKILDLRSWHCCSKNYNKR